MPQVIKFYKTGEDYDFFSNVTDIGVDVWLDGKLLHAMSSEAIFQGLKGYAPNQFNSANDDTTKTPTRLDALQLITDTRAPGAHLQRAGNQFKFNLPKAFHQPLNAALLNKFALSNSVTLKEQFMYELLLLKATQNIEVLKALLETDKNEIIENTHLGTPTQDQPNNDDFWGNGLNQKGKNALGKAWMRARETLNLELQQTGKVVVRSQFSDTLISDCFGLNPAKNQNANLQAITQQDLNNTPILKTVAEIQSRRAQTKTIPIQINAALPLPAVTPSHTRITKPITNLDAKTRAMQKLSAYHALKLFIENDKHGQNVLKIVFNSPNDALNFAGKINQWPNANRTERKVEVNQYVVTLDAITAQNVFNQLGIPTHGKTNAYRMFDALVHEANPPTSHEQPNTIKKKFISSIFFKILIGAFIATSIAAIIVISLVSAGVGLGIAAILATIFSSFIGGGVIGGMLATFSTKKTHSNPATSTTNSHAVINKVTHALPNQQTNTHSNPKPEVKPEIIPVKPVQSEINAALTASSFRLK